ncbi:hypothetical protein J2X66_005731 [Pseudomonas sp. 3296]|nr:hypothetical protein [Pseudomonas sp. 3296]
MNIRRKLNSDKPAVLVKYAIDHGIILQQEKKR